MFTNFGIEADAQYEIRDDNYHTQHDGEKRNSEDDLVLSKNSSNNDLQINEESLMLKISLLMSELISTKEKLYLYQDLCGKLRKQNEQLQQRAKDLQKTLDANTCIIDQKIQIIKKINDRKNQMEITIRDLQQKLGQAKSEEPSAKCRKKMKELTKINQLLQKQVQVANSQIIQLQRSLQDKTTCAYFGEINRLRDSNFHTKSPLHPIHIRNQTTNNLGTQSYYLKNRALSTKTSKN